MHSINQNRSAYTHLAGDTRSSVSSQDPLTPSSLGLLSPLRETSASTASLCVVDPGSASQISNFRSEIASVPPLQTPTLARIPAPAPVSQDPLTTSSSFPLGTSLRTSNFELRTCPNPQPSTFNPQPFCRPRHRSRRHGAIARLPKDCRDLVNRMLSNGVVYRNIVAALKECGHTVSERNISNWYASGYKDWLDDQAEALHHARIQDALLDHFRQTGSSQLAEIGLQTVATRLSEILLQKTVDGEDIESDLPQYRQLVDLLCRVNREILACHMHREDSAIPQGPTPERDAAQLKHIETTYSQGAIAPDPDIPQLPPSEPLPRSAEIQSAVSPAFGRHACDQPKKADPLPNAAQSSAPAPAAGPSSEISNLKCAPVPAAAVSAPPGTVQKLSTPGDPATAPDASALRTCPSPQPSTSRATNNPQPGLSTLASSPLGVTNA